MKALPASPEFYRKRAAECMMKGRVAAAVGDRAERDYWFSVAQEYREEAADVWMSICRKVDFQRFEKGDRG